MLSEILGVVVLGAYALIKSAENAPKSNWKDQNTTEKINNILQGTENWVNDETEKSISRFKNLLRKESDEAVLKAYRKCPSSDWRYEYLEEEAERRNLI